MENSPIVLEVRNISKRFPGVQANDRISLQLKKGTVMGLLGENGAGKSTLMNLIYGLYEPDEGEILVNGYPVTITGPNDAIKLGIGMVHQHFQLVDVLTVTENVMLGNERTRGLLLDRGSARKRILEISNQYRLDVEPDAVVRDLPVGSQQRVEIIKALYRNADILILDEPTAVLTPQEAQGLFGIMRTLLDRGVSLIFISHKLKEVLEICDEIVVLRLGHMVGHADPKTATEESLASMMVGRDVLLDVRKNPAQPGDVVLEIDSLYVRDDRHHPAVDHLSLEVRAGEILGIAGVQGNGQTELVEAITGLREVISGHMLLLGENITHAAPRHITESGVSHVPEDRQKDGLVGSFPVMYNMVLASYYQPPYARGILINDAEIEKVALERVEKYDVRTPNIYVNVSTLSGGNQQKVIVARELSRLTKLLIASQPTRGLDVGSIEFIHKQIVRIRDEGAAVLLVSSELDEILGLSDRIAVMYEGKINYVVDAEEADRSTIGLYMAGSVAGGGRENVG
ncbi:MAG TPA: ABC transporter ATP-binding protein [Aggregatilineales bacterium]|nr:ABC transporter ATP-binding protein [Aggregatilineales bacterium]